jgi:hypothetical protein
MSCNIIFKRGKNSLMFQNPFLIHPSYTRIEGLMVFNDILVIFTIFIHVWS